MKRMTLALLGMISTAFACAMLQYAKLGIDPFNAMIVGLKNMSHLSFTIVFILVTSLMLVLTFLFEKTYIGFTTLINLLVFGFVVEYSLNLFLFILPEPSLAIRLVTLIVGLILLSLSVALYFTASLGVSAYDAMSLIVSDRTKVSFRLCRVVSDMLCVLIGYTFGARLGPATVITAFFLGPAIDFFSNHLEPLMNRR